MDVQVEEVGPCKRLLKIEVAQEDVAERLQEGLQELRNTVQIPGFRRGRAPMGLVEKRFGDQLRDDVKNSMTGECFEEAVKEHEFVPLTRPRFENVEFDPEKPLTFEATFEIRPTIELEDYKGMKVVHHTAEPTDEEVDSQIEGLRMRRAELQLVEGGVIEDQDVIICDAAATTVAEATTEEEHVWGDDNIEVPVARGMVSGFYVPELAEKLCGAKSGDMREAPSTVPQNFEREELRGKEITLALTVQEIKRPVLPELNEDFAKTLEFDSVEEFRDEVKRQVRSMKRTSAERGLLSQIQDQLIEKTGFDVPSDPISEMAERRLQRLYFDLALRGVPQEEIEKNMAEMRDASTKAAERDLRMFLILQHIADRERIFATEEEVTQRVEAMARSDNQAAGQVMRRLEKDGSLAELRVQIRESKTMQFLLEHAEVEDEDAEKSD